MAELDGSDRDAMPGRRRKRASPFGEPSTRTYKLVTIWTGAAGGLALVSVITFAYQAENHASVFAIGTVVAAAAAFTGALFGFIFGVPRVLASDQPRGQGSTHGGSAPIVANTNLEQISDWLTKILVGVGLTQFAPIAKAANRLFVGLAPAFGSKEVGTAFAGGLILYMVTVGFATGWLFTRLFLGRAMAAADRGATALEYMDLAERAERAGDEDAARTYRSQARDVLETTGRYNETDRESLPTPRFHVYEDDVMSALRRLNLSVEREPRQGPIDATVANPDQPGKQANVIVKYRREGPFTTGDLRAVGQQLEFAPVRGGILVVTNAGLTDEVERQISGTPVGPRYYSVVTWNDERDDSHLAEAITRTAR